MKNRIFLSIFLSGLVLAGCSPEVSSLTSYPLSDNRYKISAKGNAFSTHDFLQSDWEKKARMSCPHGYEVENIDETTASSVHGSSGGITTYHFPTLSGIVRCK